MEIGIYTFAELGDAGPAVRMRELLEEVDAGRAGRPRRLRRRRAPPPGLRRLGTCRGTGGGRGGDDPDQADQRGQRAQLRRPGAGVRGVRDRRPALERPRRDHGRARLVHRVVPAVRLRPRRLRRAVRREARAAARAAGGRTRHVVGQASPVDRRSRCLPTPGAGSAPDLGRRRRLAAVRDSRRGARPADGARDHRRAAGAVRPVRRAPPAGPRSRPATSRSRSASTRTGTSPTPRSRQPTSSFLRTPR